jgi:hypothetical protein
MRAIWVLTLVISSAIAAAAGKYYGWEAFVVIMIQANIGFVAGRVSQKLIDQGRWA